MLNHLVQWYLTSDQKTSKSDARFRKYRLKRPFSAKKPPGGNKNFFQKSAWNMFLDSSRCSFVQKSSKSEARFSRYRITHARTHEHESFSSHRRSRETKNNIKINKIEFSTIKLLRLQFFSKIQQLL